MRLLRRRSRWDQQPLESCDVLLASDGQREFSAKAVERAAALADSGAVSVLTIARIYGTQFGLPHPGLMPTRDELAERRAWVDHAMKRVGSRGAVVDGQVAATRKPAKLIANVAMRRGARVIVIDETTRTGLRRTIEGNIGRDVSRKLRNTGIVVEIVPVVR